MQKFTSTELGWMVDELRHSTLDHREAANNPKLAGMAAGLHNLRAEQLDSIVARLVKAQGDGDKRIEIVR